MIKLIKEIKLFNAGYVKKYDFSQANTSEEARIEYVCAVARVCRGDKTPVKTDEELYQQLLTEHNGGPGEVFQFVPVTFEEKRYDEYFGDEQKRFSIEGDHYGIWLTNLRTIVNSNRFDNYDDGSKGFYVFKIKVPQMIVKHILRHNTALSHMEMSERTNKLREYYYCDEFQDWFNDYYDTLLRSVNYKPDYKTLWNDMIYGMSQEGFDIAQRDFRIRQELLNKGSHGLAYTTLWIAGWKQDPLGWDNFFAVRTKKPAQKEMIELANVIKDMMED